MANRIEWHGDEAMGHVRTRAVGFLRRAAIAVEKRADQLLSLPGTVQSIGGKGNKHKKRAVIHGAVRSKPGEPPRKQRGRLRASVTYEVDPNTLEARVGTNVLYGKYLELGTKRGIAPRPWLRRALAECHSKIAGFLSQLGGTE